MQCKIKFDNFCLKFLHSIIFILSKIKIFKIFHKFLRIFIHSFSVVSTLASKMSKESYNKNFKFNFLGTIVASCNVINCSETFHKLQLVSHSRINFKENKQKIDKRPSQSHSGKTNRKILQLNLFSAATCSFDVCL